MANLVTIEAESRSGGGKGPARATRRAGKVPGVVYGADRPPELIALDPRAVLREIHRSGWRSRIYELTLNGTTTRTLLREVQVHPVSDLPEHVDFQRLTAGQPIRVSVDVLFTNELASPGLKRGGVLNIVRHSVDVYCDPEKVPDHFEADLGGLDINDTVRWSSLKFTEDTHPIIADRDFVVASVAPPTKMTEAAAETPTATATPAATAATPAGPAKKE